MGNSLSLIASSEEVSQLSLPVNLKSIYEKNIFSDSD